MTRAQTKPKPRDRILQISAELFYAHDAHSVGVDKICEVADVSKRTLYKHFPTKEQLVSAALQEQSKWWVNEFGKIESDDPAECIRGVFGILQRNAGAIDFHGCPMVNTSVELRGSGALAQTVALDFKNQLLGYFRHHAEALGVNEPETLAQQLVLLHDGCSAWIVMRGEFPAATYGAVDALLTSAKE